MDFVTMIAVRPANQQDGFYLGHDFCGHRERAGISALVQILRSACAGDCNKMWAAVQALRNRQTCWIGSRILCKCFERIKLGTIIPEIWFGKAWVVGSSVSWAKIPRPTGKNGTKAS